LDQELTLHFTFIELVATASTNCFGFALSLALFHLALQLPLRTPSSQFAWTIAYLFMLADLLYVWPALAVSYALQHVSFIKYSNSITY